MKKMLTGFFGLTVLNTAMAPIGFLAFNSMAAGTVATAMAVGSFVVLAVLSNVDWKSRATFTRTLNEFRRSVPPGHEICDTLDQIQTNIAQRGELVQIAHDLGRIHGQMMAEGFLLSTDTKTPEAHI